MQNDFFPKSYEYRPQQQKIVREITFAMKHDKLSLIEAPPGTGKTLSALCATLPSVKTEGFGRIFWLGSFKTIYQNLTEDLLSINKESNGNILLAQFVSKNNMCFKEFRKKSDFYASCKAARDKGECEYYNETYEMDEDFEIIDYSDSAKDLILELDAAFRRGRFRLKKKTTWSRIVSFRCKNQFCPYEIMKKFAKSCEVFAGDYNYAFNKNIRDSMDFHTGIYSANRRILIIDEADKFYERMLTQLTYKLSSVSFNMLRGRIENRIEFKKTQEDQSEITVYKYFLDTVDSFEKLVREYIFKELKLPAGKETWVKKQDFIDYINNSGQSYHSYRTDFTEIISEFYDDRIGPMIDEFLYIFLKVDSWNFLRRAYFSEDKKYYSIEIHPLNLHKVPIYFNKGEAVYLKEILKQFTDVIFISATLYPDVFIKRMGLQEFDQHICRVVNYHIPAENYLFVIPKFLTSEYKKRESMIPKFASLLRKVIKISKKKALVFGPSKFLTDWIGKEIKKKSLLEYSKIRWSWIRSSDSRGIDIRDCNICLIAGLPYPPMNDLLSRSRFKNLKNEFPNSAWKIFNSEIISEVIQAFCRLLRKPSDKAIIILGDYRYEKKTYFDLLPTYYQERTVVCENQQELFQLTNNFFTENKPIKQLKGEIINV